MTTVEHSRLLYLLDALRSAPKKAQLLLQLAETKSASNRYRNLINRLKETKTLLSEIDSIKLEIF